MVKSVEKSTFQSTALHHNLHVVRKIHDIVSTNARLAAILLTPTSTCPNWSGGYHTAQSHGLRRRPGHVVFVTDAIGNDTPHEPDIHPKGMDDMTRLHPLTTPTPCCSPMDNSASSTL